MKIEQLSVFLENKTGRINELAHILKSANINMNAFSLAESNEFGIMRIIVSDMEKAVDILRKNKFMVSITEVLCVEIDDTPGSMADTLDSLTKNNIFIEYMYAFSHGKSAYVIIRPSNLELSLKVLNENNCKLLTKNQLIEL